MTRPPKSGSGSFRKQQKHVTAMPQPLTNSTSAVWRPQVHDRVSTPSGIGIVVEVSGELFLVDLEKQVASVWERLASIKPVR